MIDDIKNNLQPEAADSHTDLQTDLRRGAILVSSPMLKDPNFSRTAILVLDRDEGGGHIGLILNRPMELTLADVCQMPGCADNMPVNNGGPVDLQRLFWLHTLGERLPGSVEILPGLFVGGDYDSLIALFTSDEDISDRIKFYLGYSGWSAGQLENEIQSTAWSVIPNMLEPHLLLELEGDEMWHQLCLRLDDDRRHWGLFPADPHLN
ncbi:MAG: YqgE/AlgH family protein [Muribaculaceae bacterium]|nr:YqgE/AlgH family protein [Muribaculaceae bacterium]